MPSDEQSSTGSARPPTGARGWSWAWHIGSAALIAVSLVATDTSATMAQTVAARGGYVVRTAAVRTGPRPYPRAPYAYGGRHYYAYHPYVYHRYTPYYWGPGFYPAGAIVPTVTATAIVVSVADHQYHYANGIWYLPSGGQYRVVAAPVGAAVTTLPSGAAAVGDDEYYYAGAYYRKTSGGYAVVAPRAGTVVDNLPPGGQEVTVGDRKYVRFGETHYQPIDENGRSRYEVVEIE
jgi:Family of unknown function (DUF6515)